MSDYPKLLAEHFRQNYSIALIDNRTLDINTHRLRKSLSPVITSFHEFKDTPLEGFIFLGQEDKEKISARAFQILLAKIIDEKGVAHKENQLDTENLRLVIDLKTAEFHLLNKDYKLLKDVSVDSLRKSMPFKLWEEYRLNATHVQVGYNPLDMSPREIIPSDNYDNLTGQDLIKLNICNFPKWRYRDLTHTECPKILKEHFEYFVPDPNARHYFFCWLRTAVFSKNATALVLIGTKGSGKGLLEKLMSRVVGIHNYGEAPRSFFTKEFNRILKYKMLITVDELKIDKKAVEIIKSYTNDLQTIEEKGKDADELYDMHASFIISNNNKTAIHIDQDDRRFSVMDITDKSMKQIFTNQFIEELHDRIENDEELIYEFGSFLYNYDTKDFDKYKPYKGETYDDMVVLSLNMWQQTLYDVLIKAERDRYAYNEIFREDVHPNPLYKRPRSLQMVYDFVSSFLYNGKPIAELVKDEENKSLIWIVPCEALRPSNKFEWKEV